MARLKTFSEDTIFTAADATSLQLEVPPAATAQVSANTLSIVDTSQFVGSTSSARVLRQGLQCSITARITVINAGYVVNTSTRHLFNLPVEYRPATQQDLPIFGDGGRLHIAFILTNGQVHVAAASNGYVAHGANYPIGLNASWMVNG